MAIRRSQFKKKKLKVKNAKLHLQGWNIKNKFLPTSLPNKYSCKLKYASTCDIAPSENGLSSTYVWRCSDLSDPYMGVGDVVPHTFYHIMQFYNHFIVRAAKITATPLWKEGTTHFLYGISLTDSGNRMSGKTITQLIVEENTTKHRVMGIGNQSLQKYTAERTQYYSLKKFFDLPKGKIRDKNFCGQVTVSPAENAYFELWACNPTGGSATAQKFIIQIEFIADFFEPINVPTMSLDASVVENTTGGVLIENPSIDLSKFESQP